MSHPETRPISAPPGMGAMARRLFAPDIEVEEMDPRGPVEQPSPGEAGCVAEAIEQRQREFAAGRSCARRALARLEVRGFELLKGSDGAPLWPPGFVGSITHTDSWAAAAVAPVRRARALGLDVEPASPLEPEYWPTLCTAPELDWLDTQPEAERGLLAKLMFCAKECAYKCQYLLTRKVFYFHGMRLDVNPRARTFDAIFLLRAGEFQPGNALRGTYLIDSGLIMAAMTLRP